MLDNIIVKILLYPFSVIYMIILGIRNLLYDANLLKSTTFNLPVINIGNLAVGGAGKTPHVEYLIRLLRPYLGVGVMSRGYKRKSKGFRIVRPQDGADLSGDEPKQYAMKYPDITVAVAESRNTGIPEMLKHNPGINTILLDDAYQHRSVIPSHNILLTNHARIYTKDLLIPAGRLREYASAAERADTIIVTKCPSNLKEEQRDAILKDLDVMPHQKVFFTHYKYYDPYYMYDGRQRMKLDKGREVILLSAIANTDYLESYLEDQCTILNTIKFEDHHYFSEFDVDRLIRIFKEEDQKDAIILTTEKDATRLHLHRDKILAERLPVFILPLEVDFLFNQKAEFDQDIKDHLLAFKS